jgi:hypothetical protein
MDRIRVILIAVLVSANLSIVAHLNAQTRQIPPAQLKTRAVPETARNPMPFPPDTEHSKAGEPIELRSVDQMTQEDKDLASDAEASIGEHAGLDGLEFNEGNWVYQQLVCRAFPDHMFLKFTLNRGSGDSSLFTASIPRGGDGRVRIIPIQRRGYSLFSPAPINALTISAFNHIRVEERHGNAPDWLDTALCYAALSAPHPSSAISAGVADGPPLADAMAPEMELPNQGGAVIRFSDLTATPRPMEWTMTFNGKGKLLKVSHRPAVLQKSKIVPPNAAETQVRTAVPATKVE